MGLNYNERVEAYQSLTEIIRDFKDLIKNPPDLKPTVDEANAAIANAKAATKALEDKQIKIASDMKTLFALEKELDDRDAEQKSLAADLADRDMKSNAKAADVEKRKQDIVARENAVTDREGAASKKEADLTAKSNELLAYDKAVRVREDLVQLREDKLREILG